MIINCIGATRITRQMAESPDPIKTVEMESIEPNIPAKVRGTAFYFAYGSTAPFSLGGMVAAAFEKGEQVFTVEVALRLKTAREDRVIPDLDALKNSSLMVIKDLRGPVIDVIADHWNSWLHDTSTGRIVVSPNDRNTPGGQLVVSTKDRQLVDEKLQGKQLKQLIARYPVFLDYLVQQEGFDHLQCIMFNAYTDEGNTTVLIAVYGEPEIPQNGIRCSALGTDVEVVKPKRFVGGRLAKAH